MSLGLTAMNDRDGLLGRKFLNQRFYVKAVPLGWFAKKIFPARFAPRGIFSQSLVFKTAGVKVRGLTKSQEAPADCIIIKAMKKIQFPLAKVSEIHLSYRPRLKPSEFPKVSKSEDVYKILLENWDRDLIEIQEEFKVMLANRANRIIGVCSLSKGGISGTLVDAKLVFGIALKAGASSIILAHNHPSGNLTASSSDISLTKKLVECGRILEIEVFDHLIITSDGYLSLADEKLI